MDALPATDEAFRLSRLREIGILDTSPSSEFDALVRAASLACATPISLISLIDEHRQWFKANIGMSGVTETSREISFCAQTILGTGLMEVEDAASDPRFADNPLVTGDPKIRFYAGAPLRIADGTVLGALCVIGHSPMKLSDDQREILRCLASAAALSIEGWQTVQRDKVHAAELLQLSASAAERAERKAAIFDNSADLLFFVDVVQVGRKVEFIHKSFNPSLPRLTGWRASDLIGLRPEQCLPPDVARQCLAAYRQCIAQPTILTRKMTLATPLGLRDFEGVFTAIYSPATDKIIQIVAQLRDQTERNLLIEALHQGQKMEAIGRLAAGVAHDFNNILQSIISSCEFLQDEIAAEAPASEFVTITLRAARRGAQLTHHLLSYARKQILQPRIAPVRDLLDSIRSLLQRTLNPRVNVSIRSCAELPVLCVDPHQFETAILNLAINASHAMLDGGTLTIDAQEKLDNNQRVVVVSVTDTGTGMDKLVLARAIDPFFSTKGLQGVGLGLSMVHGFIGQSGGRMTIRSAPGLGTVVELYLPVPDVSPASAAAQPPQHADERPTILLVDDDPDVLVTTGAFLKQAGFAVLHAESGSAALDILARGPRIVAIVTDYAMPRLNGIDLVAKVKTLQPDVAAVIITGYAELGGDDLSKPGIATLCKPFQRQQLLDSLHVLLGKAPTAASHGVDLAELHPRPLSGPSPSHCPTRTRTAAG